MLRATPGISAVRVTGLSLACGDVEIIKRRLETGNIFNILFETVMEGVLFEQLIKGKGKRKKSISACHENVWR